MKVYHLNGKGEGERWKGEGIVQMIYPYNINVIPRNLLGSWFIVNDDNLRVFLLIVFL